MTKKTLACGDNTALAGRYTTMGFLSYYRKLTRGLEVGDAEDRRIMN